MSPPDDAPPARTSALFQEILARARLTPAQTEIVKQVTKGTISEVDLFTVTPLAQITRQLEAAELLIADAMASGTDPKRADLRERAHWQHQLAIYEHRLELLEARQALYPECWCFGRGGKGETAIVAFHPRYTIPGWDGTLRRMPLTAPAALAEAGIPDRTCREICPHCPEGQALSDAKASGERIILRDYERRSLARRWKRTGIPERVKAERFTLDIYPDRDKIDAIEAWYRGDLPDGVTEYRPGLLLEGDNQRGKSTIGYLLGLRAFDAGRGVICRTLPDLFGALVGTLDADTRQNRDPDQPRAATHEELLDDLKTTWLLLLDDLGAEKQSDYTERTIFQILEARQQAGADLRTIITTNLAPLQIAERYGQRNWMRVSGLCGRVEIDWPIMGPSADGLIDFA